MNKNPPKKPTSFDVARLAGVHRSVVSRALSGTGRMSDETRSKVMQAANELGYQVNLLARGLQNQSSSLVGIIASRLDTPYRARQVQVAAAELLRKGYTPILVTADGEEELHGLMQRLMDYRVSGMIVTSDTPPEKIIEDCATFSVPVVLINRDQSIHDADRVQIDVAAAGELAFDMLSQAGGQHFAVFEPQAKTYSVSGRARAFAATCNAAGAPCALIETTGQDYDDGVSAAEITVSQHGAVDALFCATDLMALGALDCLRSRHGVSVPEDIQLLGFDDIAQASWIGYELSTIHQNTDGAGKSAVELVLRRLEEPDAAFETRPIEISPVYRGTTRDLVRADA